MKTKVSQTPMQPNSRTLRRINMLARRLGLHVAPLQSAQSRFALFAYTREDGSFDYERYKAVQTAGNHRKLDWVFAKEENIEAASAYLRRKLDRIDFGICHGTRRGLEQKWFADCLGCEVIGTEISETATQFPNTIQWDFHQAKPEWLGRCDFIYSNSFDHSYDPKACLNGWMSCLRPGGVCILEHSELHDEASASELDPFGADLAMMPFLIAQWAQGRFALVDLIPAPRVEGAHTSFLCLQAPVSASG